jgi:hypothetical protein
LAWYSVSIKRIVGLSIFPVPTDTEATTATYSFRLEENIQPRSNYKADIEVEWGDSVVPQLAQYIVKTQPGQRGFARPNLFRMKQF